VASKFDGVWQLDLEHAKVWDSASESYQPDLVGEEIITIRTDGDVQDYEVLYGSDPTIRMGYRARFDDVGWQPYLVREIITAPHVDQAEAIAEFRRRIKATDGLLRRDFVVGQPYGVMRLISGDEHTHYRLGRAIDSNRILHTMLRRLDDDGQAYVSSVFGVDGIVSRIRRFHRIKP
jgi:hypothetical protein